MNSNALSYILRTRCKNWLKQSVKKPGRIIFMLLMVGLFGFIIVAGALDDKEPGRVIRDSSELNAIINAVFLLIFTTTLISGIQNGGTFFKMADVNFLFPSPLERRSVLIYSMVQQMMSTLFVGIFILFQYATLHDNYGISLLGLLLIFFSYSLTTFVGQVVGMYIYINISDSDGKKRLAKTIYYALIFCLLAYVGLGVINQTNGYIAAAVDGMNSFAARLFPFSGWIGAFTGLILTGNYIAALSWFLLTAVAFTTILVLMGHTKKQYYEDVIDAAETAQKAITSAKDGAVPEYAPRNVRKGAIGITKGFGASVFFYKHTIENRRSAKLILSPVTLVFVVILIVVCVIGRNAGLSLTTVFFITIYLQTLTIGNGRIVRELTKPYIYLVPEPPLKKLIWALTETIPSALSEGLFIFIPACFILGASPVIALACVIARITFSLLFNAGNIVIERIWGGSLSKVVGVLLYFLIDIILVLPGAALAYGLCTLLPGQSDLMMILGLILGNIPTTLLTLFLCRNVLQYAEMR